jgi:hypothetical protein
VVTRRVLGIELRRSAAPWAGLAVVVVALGFLYLIGGPWWKGPEVWTAQWTSAARWERYLLVFLWPIAVGAGALQGLRDRRSTMDELLSSTPRPAAHRTATTAAAAAITLVTAYLLVFAVGAVQVVHNDGYFHLGWIPTVLVGALGLVAGACLGTGLSRTFPSALVPPLLAVGSLVAMVYVVIDGDTLRPGGGAIPNQLLLLSPGLPTVRDVFTVVADSVSVGQALWFTGVAATGVLLATSATVRDRLLALLPLAVTGALAVAIMPAQTYVTDEAATALVCRGPVCVTKVHEAKLDLLAGPAGEALRLLGKLPNPPTSVRETPMLQPLTGHQPRSADVVPVDFSDWRFLQAEGDTLKRSILSGAGTPPCFGVEARDDQVRREMVAHTIAAGWLTGTLAPVRGNWWSDDETRAEMTRAWDTFQALPADQQRDRVAAMRAIALTCEGDQLAALTGAAAP